MVAELRQALSTMTVDGPTDWSSIVTQLQQALGRPSLAGIYNLVLESGSLSPRLAVISQTSSERAHAHIRGLVANAELAFDPLRVARADQNRIATVAQLIRRGYPAVRLRARVAGIGQRLVGVRMVEQMRVLITDGATLLGWVGGLSDDADHFGAREHSTLRELVPYFHKRLLLEQRLEHAPLRAATLDVALEAMTEPVLVVSAARRPVLMNSGGRALWSTSRLELAQDIEDALNGDTRKFRVTPISARGIPQHWLLVRRADCTGASARLAHARKTWGLTAREAEVLSLVAEGRTNGSVARDLACAERTVELHVTRLLQKARVSNRASLVAQFWTGKAV
ncbi:MAG: helix-turn-helix transcriptional regulator [Archangium sp.]|nr:helix-turn-helix transcriptional regulator [Archangium sp.]